MMTYEKPWMKLSVHFDVDQITNQLDYTFTSCDGSADPRHGPYMGGVHFQEGQHVYLEVTACGSKASGFTSFEIVNCCLITIPQLTQIGHNIPTLYSSPSPFVQTVGAAYQLPLDFETQVLPQDPALPEIRHVHQEWQHHLDVSESKGRWELAFVMTVRILRGDQESSEMRVFNFDPEASVGGRERPSTDL